MEIILGSYSHPTWHSILQQILSSLLADTPLVLPPNSPPLLAWATTPSSPWSFKVFKASSCTYDCYLILFSTIQSDLLKTQDRSQTTRFFVPEPKQQPKWAVCLFLQWKHKCLPPPDTDLCALLVLFSHFDHFAVKLGTTTWPLPFWSPVILNDTRKPSSASSHTVNPRLQYSHHITIWCQHLFINRLVSLVEGDTLHGISKEYIGITQ